jgi:endonuclease/exonuclease/phosphatase family metal-dependent hydrolase
MQTRIWKMMLLLVGTITVAASVHAEQSIRTGAFMINELGRDAEAEYDRSLLGLANIIRDMNVDALALQGVRDTEAGRAQVQRLVAMLNRAAQHEDDAPYEVAFGPGGEQEVVTFLWRSPVELVAEPSPMLADNAVDAKGRKLFRLMPHSARFRAGDFEFDLLSIHLIIYPFATSKHQGRAAEFSAIAQWVRERESAGGPPVIIAGVTNRLLKKNVWDRLQGPDTRQWLRFPLMEAIANDVSGFDPGTGLAPEVDHNTVTNQNRRRIWDTVAVSRSAFDRLAEQPEWDVDAGVVAFDQQHQYRWVTGRHANTIRLLTDHRPVWVELRIGESAP